MVHYVGKIKQKYILTFGKKLLNLMNIKTKARISS